MAKYFAQASIDEHGNISGGSAGNQNGKELNTRELYSSSSRPWLYVVRAKNESVRKQICEQAKAAVANPYIGYDQYQRNTVLTQAKTVGWKLADIKTACETDCSALAGLVMICGVYLVLGSAAGSAAYNALYAGGNLPATSNFKIKVPTAYFDTLNFSSFSNCQHGDILVRDGHAVIVVDAIVSSNGMSSGSNGGSLASSSYPCKGWTGDEVRKLQSALIAKGYSCGSSGVDGSFGSDTDAAVRKFQKDNGLEVDGIAGPKTQAALYASSSGGSAGYETGTYVTTVGCLNVRTGAGTGYSRKTKKQLTADGQKHSNSAGQLNAGTAVTVMQIQYDSAGNPWGMIPSGWICLAWQGKQYARKK